MNFDGYQPQTVPRFGSLVQSDDTTELPLGIASDVQNCKYRAQSVGPRDGTSVKLKFGAGNGVRGLGVIRYLAADNSGQENITVVAHTADGNVWGASPFDQSTVRRLTDSNMIAASGLALTPGLRAQLAQAYNKMIVAQGDLMTGKAPALIVDGATLECDPLTDKPFGDSWQPNTYYRVGNVVSATNAAVSGSSNAQSLFYCTQAGRTASVEPIWPAVEGATVLDGGGAGNVIWRKINIVCTSGLQPPPAPVELSVPAGTAVAPGATLFLVCTWTNLFGESLATVVTPAGGPGNVLRLQNTGGFAVDVTVTLPPAPADLLSLPPQYQPTAVNVYGLILGGTPSATIYLDPTSYAFIGAAAPGSTFTVSAAPTGHQLPTQNNAYTTDEGNVASGTRYMIVLYQDRMGYICGWSGPTPIRCDISVDGRKILVQNLPIGPYNCVARICAFTIAGQGSAGPYFYIATDDYADPGLGSAPILQTATKIPDNITTSAYFDFIDGYLEGASEVTDYFDRIELPFCSDAYFSKRLNRVVYTGCIGYPSGHLVSDVQDPGAIRIPGSNLQVSETDGDRTVCWREMGQMQVSFKENSAFSVTPDDGDPSDWDPNEIWRGSGPCNPRAVDIATSKTEKLCAYAHHTAPYVWTGGAAPDPIDDLVGTPDNPGFWRRVNWKQSQLVRTCINLREREIYFFVPLDGATKNTHRITVNFFYGLDDPIIFITRTGREVPNIAGRKWSVDPIQANDAVYVPQRTASAEEEE